MNIDRVKKLRYIHFLAAAALVLIMGAGCEFITPAEAREAIEAGREMRQFEDETIRPLEDELESLRMTEMEPRYRETEELHNEIRMIEEDVLEPLHRSFDGYNPEMDALQREAEAAYQVIQEAERDLEIERRGLEAQSRADQAALQDERDTVVSAAEEERNAIQRELNDLHRYGWDQIEEMSQQI
ncbi:MAG: hypothetical protein HQ548_01230, partial [Chloroflexi bacterium]|nr:hypothetical protein [Chloroflexota bacterium]